MKEDVTTIRVEPSTYSHRTIAEEKEKESHEITNIAKSDLTMEQSHQHIQLSQEGSDDDGQCMVDMQSWTNQPTSQHTENMDDDD